MVPPSDMVTLIFSPSLRKDDFSTSIRAFSNTASSSTAETEVSIARNSSPPHLPTKSFFLKELGHDALAHIDGNYQVICPIVAKDAGLGELGRMGLLMTPKHGPRVRIAVVTTNMPLIIDKPSFEPSIIDFCNICKKCATTCPGNAISNENQEKIGNDIRWQINQEKCYNYWTICGTDCGRCLSVCPYSHPNNLLHNFVRTGLKNSMIFRRFALKMDNILYGKKPASGIELEWINYKNVKS
jgi:ferredoxin